jgi:hypothetical protein
MPHNLSTFKRDMDGVIEYLKSGVSSHKYIQCQILLVKFMKDVLANSNEKETIESLDGWQEICEERKDLVQEFSRYIRVTQPYFLERLGCDYKQLVIQKRIDNWGNYLIREIRPLYFSVFVLDLMIRTSTLLSDVRKTEWSTKVLKNWFESQEDATNFLNRAEDFFESHGLPLVYGLPLVLRSQSQNPYVVLMK